MKREARRLLNSRVPSAIRNSLCLCVFVVFLLPFTVENRQQIPSDVRAQIRRVSAAVGLITVRDSKDTEGQELKPRGSAVVVRKDGIVVTNYHVISESRSGKIYDQIFLSLSADGARAPSISRAYRLKAVVINRERDLVLLRVVADMEGKPLSDSLQLQAIEIGDSLSVQLLDDLAIIGFPEKGGSTVTINMGVVEGKDLLEDWIKTDARLIHGNSGGAAVNLEGKLIGIPTKVITDNQTIDKDGDGFPDATRFYGAVGFLRPAHLVGSMLGQLKEIEDKASSVGEKGPDPVQDRPQMVTPTALIRVTGLIKSALDGKPVAGARVGLVPLGNEEVTAANLLTWGGTNADGKFDLNRPVPSGRYTLKVKAIRYEPFSTDVEVDQGKAQLVFELHPVQ
jgi:S1-C subfamily serine protease